MVEIFVWLIEKILDNVKSSLLIMLASIMSGFISWIIYSPLSPWSGWRAVAIGICVGLDVFLLSLVYRIELESQRNRHLRRRDLEDYIASLNSDAWIALNAVVQSNIFPLAVDDPVVAELWEKGIIITASQNWYLARDKDGKLCKMFPMMLSPVAKRILQKHHWGPNVRTDQADKIS